MKIKQAPPPFQHSLAQYIPKYGEEFFRSIFPEFYLQSRHIREIPVSIFWEELDYPKPYLVDVIVLKYVEIREENQEGFQFVESEKDWVFEFLRKKPRLAQQDKELLSEERFSAPEEGEKPMLKYGMFLGEILNARTFYEGDQIDEVYGDKVLE